MKPSVVCLGMNEESEAAIDALVEAGANILAVAGLPPVLSQGVSDFVDMEGVARRHVLPFIPAANVNDASTKRALAQTHADVLFVLGWSQLLDEGVISIFPQGVIAGHPSTLPEGRGRAPIAWTILEDREASAVSLFKLTLGVDDGAIVKRVDFEIPRRPTARVVYDLAKDALSKGFVALYEDMQDDAVVEELQDENLASWRSKRVSADGWIDFRWAAHEVDKLVRAVSEPYPGAYAYIGDKRVVFHSPRLASPRDLRRKGLPGQILARSREALLVQCGDVPLWLNQKTPGHSGQLRLRVGDRFGFRVEDELHELRQRVKLLEERCLGGEA